jgi:hypothetical protein
MRHPLTLSLPEHSRAVLQQEINRHQNAQYHHAKLQADWRQARQGRLVLDFPPPYSPELNPIERVGKRTRGNCLPNVCFPKLALVMETVEGQFARWSQPNAELATLCSI